ncbi:GIY-YIG nuclease family protein [Salipiger sp. IMCC34102]|uniref:GIY-YIG nuclease family protein n=1 Tax=Salipiger sp. IMCC34102 TaxID=2510647 RepID=UPI00101BBB59|nr:GIY-YIG nuclease family protein [Salipiger sp. IMCC34102]RYH04526.1 GIY-YIG nuclease family protein [Salipiger sp. IMCC34102]
MAHTVYILASRPHGAIYIGHTTNLSWRLKHHRAGLCGHTARYAIHILVWFENHDNFEASLLRERRIKRWRRAWKDQLITDANPDWRDLTYRLSP